MRSSGTAEALKLNPNDVNVSTDLGVSYYYTNQPDKALAQFDHSLKLDPKHAKTLLNVGIVKAFGKQDLRRRHGNLAAAHSAGAGQSGGPGRPPCPRQPQIGSPGHWWRHWSHGRHGAEAWSVMLRIVLLLVLVVFVARAFWRVVDGVVEGVTGRPPRGRQGDAFGRGASRGSSPRRPDGARSGVRHVRRARSGTIASQRARPGVLLLCTLPRRYRPARVDGSTRPTVDPERAERVEGRTA